MVNSPLYDCDWVGQYQEPKDSTFRLDDKTYMTATPTYQNPTTSKVTLNIVFKGMYGGDGFSSSINIDRQQEGSGSWTPVANPPAFPGGQKDDSVDTGVRYAYRIYRGPLGAANSFHLHSGVNIQPVESRGVALVLVENSVAAAIQTKVDRLKQDLVGDGWGVIVQNNMPKHNDAVWANNIANIATIKQVIVSNFNYAASLTPPKALKAVLLLGHIPVPRSGFLHTDGHIDHVGAWSADGYYADAYTGSGDIAWTDTKPVPPAQPEINPWIPDITNGPGDGMFDHDLYPSKLEVAVGRVDFAKLTATSKTEAQMLNDYLDKDHNYRHHLLSWQNSQGSSVSERLIGYAHPAPGFEKLDPSLFSVSGRDMLFLDRVPTVWFWATTF